MTKNIKNKIVIQIRIHFSIKQIFFDLRFDNNKENSIVKPSNIYNIQAKHKREKLRLYSAVQILILKLSEKKINVQNTQSIIMIESLNCFLQKHRPKKY